MSAAGPRSPRSCVTDRLDLLFAADRLLPASGGAERFALELLEFLRARHNTRALWLGASRDPPGARTSLPPGLTGIELAPPAGGGPYWRDKRRRREAVRRAVEHELARRAPALVVSQLHGGPGAIAAAAEAGVPGLLLLPSYEALCKYAFDAGSACVPASGCRECEAARALGPRERRELERSRRGHSWALSEAAALVAPSQAMADAVERWTNRRPDVVPPVISAPGRVRASPDGHVLLAAARWLPNKGLRLLVPIAASLSPRRVVLTRVGLPPPIRRSLERLPGVEVRACAPIDELLEGAFAALVPSLWPEPFARVAFEAMAAGVPTLASPVGGLAELVPCEQLVSPRDDPNAWAHAVRALEDPAGWREASERGIAAARALLVPDPAARLEEIVHRAARARA
jgi:glycosyltransferase involved in cell wall biosynthesis